MNQENAYAELVVGEAAETLPLGSCVSSATLAAALPADSDAELISEARLYLIAMGALSSDT